MSGFWQSKALAEVCEIKPPKSEVKRRLKDSDLVSFVPMEDLGINQKFLEPKTERKLGQVAGSYTYFADGDVLLAKITPCFENGKLGIARGLKNGIGFGSSEYIVFRPSDELSSEYLYYFLSQDSFRRDGIRTMSGAVGHKRVSKEFVEGCQIPLPSLPEQERIVAILDEAFAGLAAATANAEKNLKNARELFETALNSSIRSGGELVPLSSLAVDITDGDHMPPPKAEDGVPFITISNINKDTHKIDFTDTFKVPQSYFMNLKANRKPRHGDVLYTVTGSFGIPVVVDSDKKFCFQRHIGLVRPSNSVNSKWLYYALRSKFAFDQAASGARGAAQKTVSLKLLRNIQLPAMPPSEQEILTAKLDGMYEASQRLEAKYRRKIDGVSELKQSILQKAFSGELTSPPAQSIKEAAE